MTSQLRRCLAGFTVDYHPAWQPDQTGDAEVPSCLTDHNTGPQVDQVAGLKRGWGGGEGLHVIVGMSPQQQNLATELLTLHTSIMM